jgi:hypothetical protein
VSNLAGVISAGTLNLQGNGESFTNNDLSLGKLGYQQTWQHYIKVSAAGGINGIEIVLVDNPDYKDSGPVQVKIMVRFMQRMLEFMPRMPSTAIVSPEQYWLGIWQPQQWHRPESG